MRQFETGDLRRERMTQHETLNAVRYLRIAFREVNRRLDVMAADADKQLKDVENEAV